MDFGECCLPALVEIWLYLHQRKDYWRGFIHLTGAGVFWRNGLWPNPNIPSSQTCVSLPVWSRWLIQCWFYHTAARTDLGQKKKYYSPRSGWTNTLNTHTDLQPEAKRRCRSRFQRSSQFVLSPEVVSNSADGKSPFGGMICSSALYKMQQSPMQVRQL